jgi:outer membrane protein
MTFLIVSALAAFIQTPVQTPAAPVQVQTAPAGPVFTLDEAVAIARQNAFDIATAQSRVRQSRDVLNEARASLGPRVVANASDTHQFEGGGTGGSGGGSNRDSRNAGVQFNMPIDITGIVGRGIKGAAATVKASQSNLEATQNSVVLDTRTAYYDVLRASALVGVAQAEVNSAQQGVKTEQQQFEAGVVAQVDVLRLQAQLAQAQSDLISAQNNLDLAKENLNNTIGRPIETPFEPQDIATLPTVGTDADTLARAAISRRPEVQAIRYQREALAWITRAQEGGLMPSLNLSAGYNRNLNAASGVDANASSATISLSWPIFDSGLTRARVASAREDERQAEISEAQLELGVSLEVRQAVTNLGNSKATLDVAQSQVTAAAETYRLAQVRLQAGEGTSLEVSTALTALVQAQQGLANARYNYLTAYAQLQRAVASDDPNAIAPGQGTGTK